MGVSFSQFSDENKFFVAFIVVNNHNVNVRVKINVSGQLEINYLEDKKIFDCKCC